MVLYVIKQHYAVVEVSGEKVTRFVVAPATTNLTDRGKLTR